MRIISCKQCFIRKYVREKTLVPTIASGLQVNALEARQDIMWTNKVARSSQSMF
jgi:hypothetical protein